MNIPVWQILTWEPVALTVDTLQRMSRRLRHLATSPQLPSPGAGLRQGQVLWGAKLGGRRIGVAWDWAEMREGVVVLSDPMSIISNVRLLDAHGQAVPAHEGVLHLNSVVHGLDWHADVLPGWQVEERLRA